MDRRPDFRMECYEKDGSIVCEAEMAKEFAEGEHEWEDLKFE